MVIGGLCVKKGKHEPFDFNKARETNKNVRKYARENLRKLHRISNNYLITKLEEIKKYKTSEERKLRLYHPMPDLNVTAGDLKYRIVPMIKMLEEIIELKKNVNRAKYPKTKEKLIQNYVRRTDLMTLERVGNLEDCLEYYKSFR